MASVSTAAEVAEGQRTALVGRNEGDWTLAMVDFDLMLALFLVLTKRTRKLSKNKLISGIIFYTTRIILSISQFLSRHRENET